MLFNMDELLMSVFKKGGIIEILPEYQDKGDGDFTWVVIEDEEKGRVTVSPIDSPLTIKPTYVMRTFCIRHKFDSKKSTGVS